MSQTVYRKNDLRALGIHDFLSVASPPRPPNGEDAFDDGDDRVVLGSYLAHIKGARIRRANQYYTDDDGIGELAIYQVILNENDDLLYAMLGGVDRAEAPGKVTSRGND